MTLRLAYLGPSGTFTEQAATDLAKRIGGTVQLEPKPTLHEVARIAMETNCHAVMAYHNAVAGTMRECLQLIAACKLEAVGLVRLPITLNAGIAPGTGTQHTGIYSHPKAIEQTLLWRQEHYPKATLQLMESTAAAARKVSEQGTGIAIASEEALKTYGLKILANNIGDIKNNYTDFLHVRPRQAAPYPLNGTAPNGYATIIVIDTSPIEIPQRIAGLGLPTPKILSTPLNNGDQEAQRYYIEITHNERPEQIRALLTQLQARILGAYALP